MCDSSEPLVDAEEHAIRKLNSELREHGLLTLDAFNLLGIMLSRIPQRPVKDVPQSSKVAYVLLGRLSNDLRSAALLALRGYAIQAASLVSSIYEATFTVAYIGSDEIRAQAWIDHTDPTICFRPVREMTREAVVALGVPDPEVAAANSYRTYRQLCMAKHANPLLQSRFGHEVQDQAVVFSNGPDASEQSVRVAWFALEHAAGLACVAMSSFLACHLDPSVRAALNAELANLEQRRGQLNDLAKARWGTEDPFPGKW